MDRRELEARIALIGAEKMGPVRVGRLMGGGREVAPMLSGSPPSWMTQGTAYRESFEEAARRFRQGKMTAFADRAKEMGLRILMKHDEDYPSELVHIPQAPQPLWVLGDLGILDTYCIAIVGTRRCSDYGRRTARRLAAELAQFGITIISGLAEGIDSAAHYGALDAGGKTAAVLGTGPDRCYPAANRELQRRISREGVILSEFALGMPPVQANFPRRNRIISGLSQATVVVEAFEKGGALTTARLANDQGKSVFAVPGRVGDPMAEGTNGIMVRCEAQIGVSAKQIVKELHWDDLFPAENESISAVPTPGPPRSQWETAILERLESGPLHLDQLAARFEGPAQELWRALLRLECDGFVRELEGNRFETTELHAAPDTKSVSRSTPPGDRLTT